MHLNEICDYLLMNKFARIAIAPRHSIVRDTAGELISHTKTRKSLGIYEAFQNLTDCVIPKIQEFVEWRSVNTFASSRQNELEKQEVIDSYMQRKTNIGKTELKELKQEYANRYIDQKDIDETIYSYDGKGLSYMTHDDIGKYVIFPKDEYKKVFPVKPYGSYVNDELMKTKIYSVKCREEALRITNFISYKRLPKERSIHLSKDYKMTPINLDDPHTFSDLYQEIADVTRNTFEKLRQANNIIQCMYDNAMVFDSIVTLLIQSISAIQKNPNHIPLLKMYMNSESLELLIRQIIVRFEEVCKKNTLKPLHMREILEFIDEIELKYDLNMYKAYQFKSDMPSSFVIPMRDWQPISQYLWRPQAMLNNGFKKYKGFNTGALLYGERGVGKSQILAFATLWAHENNWFTIPVVKASDFTLKPAIVDYHYSGLHLDINSAAELLQAIHTANTVILNEIDVDINLYGKCDLAGHHQDDPDPVPKIFDADRKCWNDDWRKLFPNEKIKEVWETVAKKQLELLDRKHKQPKKLIDIITPALKDPVLCTTAIAELMVQLKQTNACKVFVGIDEYNEWYLNSGIPSFRYENDPMTRGHIPAHDFAIPHMMMRLDGHKMKNGFKLFSTSNWRFAHHICTPEKISFVDGYSIEIENMRLDDFRRSLKYFAIAGYSKVFLEWEIERYYMECQGNIRDFHKSYFEWQSEFFGFE